MSFPSENAVRLDLVTASRLAPSHRPSSIPESDGGWNLDALAGRFVEISGTVGSVALTAATSLVVAAQLRSEPTAWVGVGTSSVYPVDLAESGVDLAAFPLVRASNVLMASRAAERLLRSGGFALIVVDLIGQNPTRQHDRRRFSRSYGPTFSQNGEFYSQRVLHEVAQRQSAETRLRSRPRQRSEQSQHSQNRQKYRRYVSEFTEKSKFAGRSENSLPASSQTRLVGLARKHRTVLLFLTRKETSAPSLGSLVSLRGTGRVRKTAFDRFAWTLEVQRDKHRKPGWTHSEVCRGPTGLF